MTGQLEKMEQRPYALDRLIEHQKRSRFWRKVW